MITEDSHTNPILTRAINVLTHLREFMKSSQTNAIIKQKIRLVLTDFLQEEPKIYRKKVEKKNLNY